MTEFIKLKVENEDDLHFNTNYIEAIIEEKKGNCIICCKNFNYVIDVLDSFEDLKEQLPEFFFATLKKNNNRILINLKNVNTFYLYKDGSTMLVTNLTLIRKRTKGYIINQCLDDIKEYKI